MKIYFHNKGIEKINLPQLMKKLKTVYPLPFVTKTFPPLFTNDLRQSRDKYLITSVPLQRLIVNNGLLLNLLLVIVKPQNIVILIINTFTL